MTIHPTAIVAPEAKLASDVEIGPYSIVGPDVTLEAGVRELDRQIAALCRWVAARAAEGKMTFTDGSEDMSVDPAIDPKLAAARLEMLRTPAD